MVTETKRHTETYQAGRAVLSGHVLLAIGREQGASWSAWPSHSSSSRSRSRHPGYLPQEPS